MQEVSTELYQKAAQEAQAKQAQQGEQPKGKDEKVVDADYKVKDEKK